MSKANPNAHTSQSIISLSSEPEVLELLANSILGLWDVVNNLTRLRPTQRERYRVTIFGSAQVPEDHWVYAAVRDVAEELTRIGTVLEAMMIWQLLQVGHLQRTPLILVGKMYADLVAWCERYMLRPDLPLAHPEDIALSQCVEDGPGILRILRGHYDAW